MSIELKEVVIRNWLVYQGQVKLTFAPPEPGRNLWVIHGLNGTGKTSLLKAIQWVFRNGRSAEKFFVDGQALHNWEAIRLDDDTLEVSVKFIHRKHECLLQRRQIALIRDHVATAIKKIEMILTIDGRDESHGAEDKLAKMLPWDCQQFAFFDGLEIQSYAKKYHSDETRKAIELILGIPEVRNLRDDLQKLKKNLEDERDIALGNVTSYKELKQKKDYLEDDKQTREEQIHEQKNKIGGLEEFIKNFERQANDLAGFEERIKDLQGKEKFARELNERLRELEQKQLTLTAKAPQLLLRGLLKQRLQQIEDEAKKHLTREKRRFKDHARIAILEEILEKGRCLCTRELTPELSGILESELESGKASLLSDQGNIPSSLNKDAKTITATALKVLLAELDKEQTDPKGLQLLFLKKQQLLEEVEQDIEKLNDQLKEHANEDVHAVYQALHDHKKELKEAESELVRFRWELKTVNENLLKLEKDMNKLLSDVEGFKDLQMKSNYVKGLQRAIEELVDSFIRERHSTIQSNLNRVFKSITNKPQEYDHVALLEDFSVRVVTKAGNQIEPEKLSAGEKEVLAFSFIAGLNLASENPAPLVMDTPFGHLDNNHRNGLLEALPSLPNQVILLATDRDLPKDERKRFDRNIVGEFELYRMQHEERTTIRPF